MVKSCFFLFFCFLISILYNEIRYFISIYLQRFGLPHRDNFENATIETILQTARKRNDRRTMRLFGHDETLNQRQQTAWQRMIEEDKQAILKEP